MTRLRVIRPETREEQIDALARHMIDNPDACRQVAASIIDGTVTLAKAGVEIQRLRDLLAGGAS